MPKSSHPLARMRWSLIAIAAVAMALAVGPAGAQPPQPVQTASADRAGPTKLTTRPELRLYSCLHASQGYTGFGEPPIRFRLKSGGVWIDRTFKDPIQARWVFRRAITTLFTKKGSRYYRFTHWRDSSGKYLVEEPRGSDPLICR